MPPKPKTDATLRSLGRLVLGAFFRKIEVVGADRLPKTGPVIVVANHFNSLVDGLVITAFLPRMPRFLTASTVWDYKPIGPFLNAAGAVPIHRKQDGRSDESSLNATFQRATELLGSGGVLAIFPEGLSHNEPFVLPLKSGAARIALEAEAVHGPLGVRIVPVCLTFEEKNKFRTRILVEIGEPIALAENQISRFTSDEPTQRAAAIRDVTELARQGLEDLVPMHASWEEARLIGRAAEIVTKRPPGRLGGRDLSATTPNRRALQRGYLWAQAKHPDQTEALRRELAEYDAMLRMAGLQGDRFSGAPANGGALRHMALSALLLVVLLPFYAIGLLLNWVPYRILFVISRRKDLDKRSSWSIFAGLFLFPLFWIGAALLLGNLGSGPWGAGWGLGFAAAVLLAAPVTGKITVKFIDVLAELKADFKAWSFFRKTSALNEKLLERRASILGTLRSLSERFQAEQSSGNSRDQSG